MKLSELKQVIRSVIEEGNTTITEESTDGAGMKHAKLFNKIFDELNGFKEDTWVSIYSMSDSKKDVKISFEGNLNGEYRIVNKGKELVDIKLTKKISKNYKQYLSGLHDMVDCLIDLGVEK